MLKFVKMVKPFFIFLEGFMSIYALERVRGCGTMSFFIVSLVLFLHLHRGIVYKLNYINVMF